MKRTMVISMVGVMAMLASGCASMGLFSKLQTADDALAVKYGIPVEVVAQARTVLGIPDARTLPGPERVLPPGLALTYDMLDASNNVVDVSLYHRSTMPRIVPAGSAAPSVFDQAAPGQAGTASLESLLKMITAGQAKIPGI